MPLFVYASTVTDAEVLSRELGALRPSVVVLGVSAPDMGTTLEVDGAPVTCTSKALRAHVFDNVNGNCVAF